jgi:uncharacterized protein YecE (DUF72 family)
MAQYWVGTSGYNYQEWKGAFYPEDLSEKRMLGYYAERFPTVEINYTFYRMPTARILSNWARETPDKFLFTLKAPRRITHEQRLRSIEDTLASFCEIAETLGPKLGPILFQLPPFLKKDVELLEVFLHDLPTGLRATIEFRHASWHAPETYKILERFGVALCIADTDEHTTPFEVTAPFGYLRLRRAEYDEAALTQWIERIDRVCWDDAFVYFKHEDEARGPRYAEELTRLVGDSVSAR